MQNLTVFIQFDKTFFSPDPKINLCSVAQVTSSVRSTVTGSPPHLLYNPHQSRPRAAQYIPSGVNFSKSTHSTISSLAFKSALQQVKNLNDSSKLPHNNSPSHGPLKSDSSISILHPLPGTLLQLAFADGLSIVWRICNP